MASTAAVTSAGMACGAGSLGADAERLIAMPVTKPYA